MAKFNVGDKARIDEPLGGHKSPWIPGMRAVLSEGTEVEIMKIRESEEYSEPYYEISYPGMLDSFSWGLVVHSSSLAPSDS